MGSAHQGNSRDRLHDHFPWFSREVCNRIKSALKRVPVGAGGKIRVLDIGHGTLPYGRAFADDIGRIDLTLLDSDATLSGPAYPALSLAVDFFAIFDEERGAVRPVLSESLARHFAQGSFGLIVLSASMHELHYDALTRTGSAANFHDRLLRFLRTLLTNDGCLLIADYAWSSSARAADTFAITDRQRQVCGHADPPWAFVDPQHLQDASGRCGFKLATFLERGLYDDSSDDDLAAMLQLAPDGPELETLRQRLGFILTLSAAPMPAERPDAQVASAARPRLAALLTSESVARALKDHLRHRPAQLTASQRRELSSALTQAFVGQPILDGRSALWHLSTRIAELADVEFRRHWERSAGTYETWFSLGLETINDRFIPRLHSASWPNTKPQRAGVLSLEVHGARLVSDALTPGPVCDAYADLMERHSHDSAPATIHSWAVELHRCLQRRKSHVPVGGDVGDLPKLRSITLLFPYTRSGDELVPIPEPLASLWPRTIEDQRHNGHFMCVLRPPLDGETLVDQVDAFLWRVSKQLGCEVRLSEGRGRYDKFLTAVFAQPPSWRDWFKREWSRTAGGELPVYRAYSTIIDGCDGLTASLPDTVMIFGCHPFPPPLLESIDSIAADFFRPAGGLETEVRQADQAEAKEREQRLTLIAGTSHTFKNLLTPLRGGLRDVLSENSLVPAVAATYEFLAQTAEWSTGEDLCRSLADAHADLIDRDVLEPLLSMANSLSGYRNIVERLWGKIYGLYVSSLTKDEIKDKWRLWQTRSSVRRLFAGSFFVAWYDFQNDDTCSRLRSQKHFTANSTATLRLTYRNAATIVFDETLEFATASSPLSSNAAIREIRQVDQLLAIGPEVLLPRMILETVTEECFLNAIKYGVWGPETPIHAVLNVDHAAASPELNLSIVNSKDIRVGPTRGKGRAFVSAIVNLCGGKVTTSPDDSDSFEFQIQGLPVERGAQQ